MCTVHGRTEYISQCPTLILPQTRPNADPARPTGLKTVPTNSGVMGNLALPSWPIDSRWATTTAPKVYASSAAISSEKTCGMILPQIGSWGPTTSVANRTITVFVAGWT